MSNMSLVVDEASGRDKGDVGGNWRNTGVAPSVGVVAGELNEKGGGLILAAASVEIDSELLYLLAVEEGLGSVVVGVLWRDGDLDETLAMDSTAGSPR